ncbi:hypothetical protein OUZ56_026295 [Daphnia magna]|uniref:Uncharacterized protein n=1 Tax=Daphnia magna TaxID=35525 RepID=A0ABQ9ZLH3_9CRUS|nr:hypothetical protein OUZ56_026295 [Daphnia magna]
MYKPTLKRKANILINPSLYESVFLRLKTFKGSHATKANIDPTEKTLRSRNGRRITQAARSRRLEAVNFGLHENSAIVEFEGGPIRKHMECATSDIPQLVPAARCVEDGRIHAELEGWFPIILELAMDVPRMLFPEKALLTSPLGECHQLTTNHSIRLIAWRLSGVVSVARAFRQKLSNCSYQ